MSIPEFLQSFEQPDPRFSPVPIWWWSGEKLQIDRLQWQMDQLLAMGIHNVVILNLAPSGPMFGSDADDPPFLSQEWWAIFGQVCDHAATIGMFIWFYDQIGFSGANYQAELVATHPQFQAQQLRSISVEGSGELALECPASGTPIASYLVSASSEVRYVPCDGRRVVASVATPARLRLVYAVRQGYDYFQPAACGKLLDTVHREFARRLPQHIGKTIVGSFQDELPDLPTWGRHFADSFAEQFGYRIEGVIHRLFEAGDSDSRRTRLHYHQHRASLAEEALFKPFYRWHEEHGLQCGFDQQSPAREGRAIGCVAKYADYIQTHRWYAAPGCDLHGNAKIHSSIAFMYNRPRVWIEGFHSTGWGGTIADTFDWLLPFLQAGANLYNPHAIYYSTRMGWWEWAPPSTCWRQPYAMHYRSFAELIARLTKLLSQGVQQADVGVLFPTATVQSALGPSPDQVFDDAKRADQTLHELLGSMRWYDATPGLLDEANIAFHLLDEPSLESASVALEWILYHGAAMQTLILPNVTILDDVTVGKITAFAKQGVRILAIGTGLIETPDGATLDLRSLPNATVVSDIESLRDELKRTPRWCWTPVPALRRRIENLHLLFIPANAGMATKVQWRDWFATLERATIDLSRVLQHAQIRLPSNTRSACRYDPVDGSVKQLTVEDGRLDLDFDGAPFAVILWPDEPQDAMLEAAPPLQQSLQLADQWRAEYVPTLPTEYADVYDPRRPELRWPHTAEFDWRVEGDVLPRQVVRATFGVHGWITSPDGSRRPLVYSPQFGIAQDQAHWYSLGPKGHVPEEFIDLGPAEPGHAFVIETGFLSQADRDAVLAIGANARKSAEMNQAREEEPRDHGHLWMLPVRLRTGENSLRLTLTASHKGRVRAFWCCIDPAAQEKFRRPEAIRAHDGPIAGSNLGYVGRFEITSALPGGKVQVAVAAVASVYLDGKLLGCQGGFDPYRIQARAQAYLLPALEPGAHALRIDLIDPGVMSPLMVDLRVSDVAFTSDASWTVRRDDGAEARVTCDNPGYGGASWHLYRRPHPLRGAAWLEGPQPDVVLDLPTCAPAAQPMDQIFEWTIPPGAVAMDLPLVADAESQLLVDGVQVPISSGKVEIGSHRAAAARRAMLRVRSRQLGGGVFRAPVTYRFEQGVFPSGSWLAQGLRSYSGAIRMTQRFNLDSLPGSSSELDLGLVRGTVAAQLNGKSLGQRVIPPYRFSLGGSLRVGENELVLMVTNTLANFLSTSSPTRGWSPDQFESGVFGPVQIRFR